MEERSALAFGDGENRLPSGQDSPPGRQTRCRRGTRTAGSAGTRPAARTLPRRTPHRRRPCGPNALYLLRGRSRWRARQLTDEQWTGIIGGLLRAFPEHTIVVHGAAGAVKEFARDPRVVSYGQGSVQELFEKISAADLVIAPDSFALHLASFYDVPAIGYFGPAHPHRFRPTGPGSTSLFHQPECSPCLQRARQHLLPQGAHPMQFAGGDDSRLSSSRRRKRRWHNHGHCFAHA